VLEVLDDLVRLVCLELCSLSLLALALESQFGIEDLEQCAFGSDDALRGQSISAFRVEQVLQRNLPELVEVLVVQEHMAPRQ